MDFAMRHKLKLLAVALALLGGAVAATSPTTFWSVEATAGNACTQTCQVKFQQCMKSSGDRNACTDELNSCRNQCFAN